MALTKNQVSEIRLRLNNGEKGCNLAKEFGVSNGYISQIKSKKKGMKQVWLTVEEAKGIYETIEEAKEFLWKYHKVPLTELGQKDFDTLKERIEQTEGKE